MVFENTPLKTVVSTLTKQFKVQFNFQNPALKDCELTAKFEQESLEEIIEMLEFLFNRLYSEVVLGAKNNGFFIQPRNARSLIAKAIKART